MAAIRIMTIHGAKGLEAPVVILPECAPMKKPGAPDLLVPDDDAPVLWKPRKSECNDALLDAAAAWQDRQAEERDRLLYVAMTRAESWLICASAGSETKAPGDGEGPAVLEPGAPWRDRIAAAMRGAGAREHAFEGGAGLRLETGDWTGAAQARAPARAAPPTAPVWLETHAAAPPTARRLFAPSDLGGAKALPFEETEIAARSDGPAGRAHGTRVHALLEHLPALTPDIRDDAADAILSRPVQATPDAIRAALAEARAAMDAHPDVFAPGTLAEMPFVLPADGGRPALHGTMDRVAVTADAVRIVDHKTNRAVPATPGDVPEGILRQIGAYAAAAAAIWPGRAIRCAILWTAEARLMDLPHDSVRAAWMRAGSRDASDGAR